MKNKAVFFDLFETLITEFADRQRISKRHYDYDKLLGLTNEEFKSEWNKRFERRMSGHFEHFAEVIRDITASRGLPCDESAVRYLYEQRTAEKKLPFREINPDIADMLQRLRSMGLRIGLISNCTEEEVQGWEDSGLAEYFDDRIFSYEAKCCKPDAKIYELACSRLGVAPHESVFVGDGGSRELEGADRAGFAKVYHAVWFNGYIESDFKRLLRPTDLVNELEEGH